MILFLTRVQQKLHRVLGKLGGGRTTRRRSQLNSLSQHTVAGLERRTLLTNYADYVTTFETTLEETLPPVGTIGWFDGIATYPQHGTLTPLPGGSFRYEPDDGYAGPDYFEYKFHEYIDYGEGTPTENDFILPVGIVVYLPPPEAYDDSTYDWEDPETGIVYQDVNYFVLEGNALSIPREDGVLKNDIDWRSEDNWDTLTAIQKTGVDPLTGISYDPAYGSVSLSGDGSFTYTPNAGVFDDPTFSGLTDTFVYYVMDEFGQTSGGAVVTVDLAKVVITRGGVDVDTDATQLDVWVGESIKPQATFIGGGAAPVKYQWSVGSKAIDNFVEVPGQYARVTPLNTDELKTAGPSFYWIDGGSKSVSVTVKVVGQTATDNAGFTVRRPNRQVTSQTATGVTLRHSGGTVHVYYGDIDENGNRSQANPGIRFSRTSDPNAPSPEVGDYRWTQIVSTYVGATFGSGAVIPLSQSGLDNRISYGNPIDTPGVSFPDTPVSVDYEFSAEMYLMFKPNKPDSIWVPLQVVQWSVSWTAVRVGDNIWTIESENVPNSPSGQDTTNFPEWEEVVTND